MMQSLLANFSILLFMHLCIQSVYYIAFRKQLPDSFVAILHVVIVAVGIILLYMLPVTLNDYRFDLRTIPMVFIVLYHGYKHGLSVLAIVIVARFAFPGESLIVELLYTLVIPTIVTLVFRNKIMNTISYFSLFIYFSAIWVMSDAVLGLMIFGANTTISTYVLHFISFQLSAMIMYFFIQTSTKNLEMSEQLRYYAEHDSLTGLLNLRSFLKQAKERESKLTQFVAMIDLDYFKVINDTYGHLNGDRVLEEFSSFLSLQSDEWLMGRYGGEEFILLIEVEQTSDAYDRMKKLQAALHNHLFTTETGEKIEEVSISIGLAEWPQNQSIMPAIDQADHNLYQAKRNGRNQVWV
ncbi:GGDEF domain-containing protein [Pseudalkalibacillus hwajinpoensis]|uniref:GGDEF domain-containing protein n=1 Tax=Guptibacillus hwajinpoensis TaxID=208199 RepID=A0A4U1M850_9BACL|nr:GGDEF domain-containing protein [Pseudalkalibacillus hwajinpoensis]TKD66452.1 GGDEF domain-containing protein [Pseudalkalibacillus hwajinpoensis]